VGQAHGVRIARGDRIAIKHHTLQDAALNVSPVMPKETPYNLQVRIVTLKKIIRWSSIDEIVYLKLEL